MAAPVARGVSSLLNQLRDGAKGLLPVFGLILYTIIGALLFRELEAPFEQYTLETMQKERAELLEDTVYRLNNVRNMQPVAAYNHTRKMLLRYQDRLGVEEVDPVNSTRWTLWGSTFYCLTVYTTIGYGNIAPVTAAGRILTILYAFAGIPLALISLYSLGLLFGRCCRFVWKGILKSTAMVSKDLERKVTDAVGLEEGAKTADKSENSDDDLLSFPISFLVFVTILWIFICAAIFLLFEDWDYGTSLYFTLISFTTIGFGDIVPSEFDYVVVVGILLLIGLSLVSTVLTLIQQQIEALASGMQANIDKEYLTALAEAEDEGEIDSDTVRRMSVSDTNTVQEKEGKREEEKPEDKKSLDAVISRMPMKERMMYYVMPASSKKVLQKSAEQKANRKNKGCQTEMILLEALIKEEILKLELNNELDRVRPSRNPFESSPEKTPEAPPRLVSRGFKIEKVTPIEISSNEDEPAVIRTTMIKEDDV